MLKFYMDHELEIMWREFDRRMYDDEWRVYVFAFRLMLCTGNRVWETTQIRVEDCEPDYIHIRFGKGEGIVRGEHKERYADVHPEILRPYYREYLDSLPPTQEWLFPAQRNHWIPKRTDGRKRLKHNFRTIGVRTIRARWEKFCEMIDIRYLPLHEAFRKTFATWFAEDMRREDLQDQLGHKDYRTTDKIYRGSIPGRRFVKPAVQWKETAKKLAAQLERRKHLKVV